MDNVNVDVLPVPKCRCPFYGFYQGPGILIDQQGNQCALITKSYSPCKMEVSGDTPNWGHCRYSLTETSNTLQNFRDKFSVILHGIEKVISFEAWAKHVLYFGESD